MHEKRILNFYSIIIGVLFIISGIGKVIDTWGFSNLIYQYGLGHLMILAPLIVLVEILLGLFLILLISPKRVSMISSFMLVIFTISFAYAHFAKGVNDCGCFGSVQHVNLPPIFSFIRNIILIVIAVIVWIKYPKEKTEVVIWKKNVIIFIMSISIFIAGCTFRMPYHFTNKEETHKFQNQNIKKTELAKYIKTSSDSTYLVFCFSYTCPHCLNSIENMRQYKNSNTVDSIITIVTKNAKEQNIFIENFHPDFKIIELSDNNMGKLTNAFPTTFFIKNNSIQYVIQGELPSSFVFNQSHLTFKY